MKLRAVLGCSFFLVLSLAAFKYSNLSHNREPGLFDGDPPTPYFRYLPPGTPRGRVLVVHGLDGSKEALSPLCFGLSETGFEVFAIDLPGHGASSVPFDLFRSKDAVAHALDRLGPDTAVIGHSLGGALLLELANQRPMGSMVLFSPAPTPLVEIQSPRVLLFEGKLDVPRIRTFAPLILDAARTVEFNDLAWIGHSGAPAQRHVIAQVATWLGGNAVGLQTSKRLGLLLLMFVSAIALGVVLLGPAKVLPVPKPRDGIRTTILLYIGAACLSAVILGFVPVARWLRFFATDYLIGFLFLTGSFLCLARVRIRPNRWSVLIAVLAAIYVLAIPGGLVASQFTHFALSAARSWRFAAIVLLSLPLFLADEVLIRPIPSRWKAAGIALLTRAVMSAVAITAALLWNREAVFLALIIHLLLILWMALWFCAGILYRRTADPFSAAFFVSLLQAWLFASLFVVI